MSERPIHKPHPNGGPAHPLKALTLCGKMVRFGGFEMEGRETSCKLCLKIHKTICPTCGGTGVNK